MVQHPPLSLTPPFPTNRTIGDGCTTQVLSMFRDAHVDNPARAAVLILRQDALGFREAEARAADVAVVDENCGQVLFLPHLHR